MAAQNSTRKWMFIGGGVIAAAALVVGFQNYPPQPKDAAGTIGAAQRYHEPQITGDDVKVTQDELTVWLQSETFDRIVKDPEARRLFTNEAVQRVLADDARRQLSVSDDARKQIQVADDARKQLSVSDDARKQIQVADDARRQLSVSDDARKQIQVADDARKQLSIGDLAAVNAALQNDAIRFALSSEAFCRAMANDAMRNALVGEARKLDSGGRVD